MTSNSQIPAIKRFGSGLGTTLLCLGTVAFILPFLFTVVTSLRTAADVAKSPWASRTR